MDQKDPFEMLMNAGSNPELWVLIAGPVGALALIVITYAIIVSIRNKRERADFNKVIEAEAAGIKTQDLAPDEDEEAAPPYEVPPELAEPERPKPKLSVVPTPIATPEPAPITAPPAAAVPKERSDVEEIRATHRGAWLKLLGAGLAKTRDAFKASLGSLFSGKTKIDQSILEKLHEALYRADIGVSTADKLVNHVRETLGKEDAADWASVAKCLKDKALAILSQGDKVINKPESGPQVILIVGVNGVGKTTTIGKLGAHLLAEDRQVLLCAADTFRAAAIEQLQVWGDRLGVDVVKHKQGSDPAAVAYDGVKAAIARKVDTLLIDTAGRLHNKQELMSELSKVNRVIGKDLPGAPHETWLVLDATTGQNAFMQVKAFREAVGITGLIVTKLDGTAKGGVLIGIADQFGVPIRYVGVGEKAADLRGFEPRDFVESLF